METLLARLFASPREVERFLQDREQFARDCGLTDAQLAEILEIDAASLRFAARSYERKRQRGG
jgi:pantoate kinase